MTHSPDSISSLESISRALQPVMSAFDKRLDDIERKHDTHTEVSEEKDKHIIEYLDRIEQQTIRTNGRVTQLEGYEKYNKIVRYILTIGAVGVLAAVGNALLTSIKL